MRHSRRRVGFLLAAFGVAAAFAVPLTLRRTVLLGGLTVVAGRPVVAEASKLGKRVLNKHGFNMIQSRSTKTLSTVHHLNPIVMVLN